MLSSNQNFKSKYINEGKTKNNSRKKPQYKMAYPVDDTQGQGFAVESIQDSNFRSCIQIFDQCTDQK